MAIHFILQNCDISFFLTVRFKFVISVAALTLISQNRIGIQRINTGIL